MLEPEVEKPTILIVDDDPRVRDSLTMMLSDSRKYNFLTVENGEEALTLLRSHKTKFGFGKNEISCVVLDIKMPVLDGLSFLKEWRLEEKCHLVPIVLLTAYEDQEKWEKAIDPVEGVIAAYLKKPIKPDLLFSTLKSIIEHHEMEVMVSKLQQSVYDGRQE